jgi:hypothetical protein
MEASRVSMLAPPLSTLAPFERHGYNGDQGE